MTTNTSKHISDWAESVKLDTSNTPFGSSVTNVQLALDAIGDHALEDGLPIATIGQQGIIYLATQADVDEGTDPNKAITPQLLEYALTNPYASETEIGWTRYATDTESLNTSFETAATTPKNIHYIFENRNATETLYGSVRLSSSSQATTATNNTTATTPLRVKEMIDTFSDTVSTGTESVTGIVELATVAETNNGVVREGMAISPYSFTRANASESNFGTSRLATQAETDALVSDSRVITPLKLGGLNASTTQKGLVELATQAETNALTSDSLAITPLSLSTLNASTTQKGLVELATEVEVEGMINDTKAITPSSLSSIQATASDPLKLGLVRLSNSITSTSNTSALSSYGAKLLNDKIEDISIETNEWEVIYDAGTGRSSSYIMSVPRNELDGCEFKVIFINSENEIREFHGCYSSKFNNGNTSRIYQVGGNDNDIKYEINNERFTLSRSENKFIIIMKRRIPILDTGYTYTGGTDGGGTDGGGGGGYVPPSPPSDPEFPEDPV